jgi:hypothetical protein
MAVPIETRTCCGKSRFSLFDFATIPRQVADFLMRNNGKEQYISVKLLIALLFVREYWRVFSLRLGQANETNTD